MVGGRGTAVLMVFVILFWMMVVSGIANHANADAGSSFLPSVVTPKEVAMQIVHSPMDAPWSTNIKISDDPGTQGQNEVSIVSDTNGNLYAGWNDNRKSTGNPAYQCAFTQSSDGGQTWSANDLYTGPEPECGDPVVTQDWKGGMYRLGMSFNRNGNSAHLDVSHTTDGGKTWGAWHTAIDSTKSGGMNDKPWMAAYGNDVYVTWTLFGGGEINFIKSTDEGATWSSPMQLGGGQGSCIVTDNSENIYVGWGISSISFRKSTDGGSTFSSSQNIGNGGGGGSNPRSSALPGCAVDPTGTHVYYTWAGNTGGSEDVWVVHSGDGGTTWGNQVKVNDDTNNARQIMSWIALDGKNVPHVGWTDWRNGKVDAYYSNSSDNGQTWTPNLKITDGSGSSITFQGDYQGITVTPKGRVVAAWCDTRNGNGDLYAAYADIGAGGGGGQTLKRIDVSPPNPSIIADQTQQFTATGYDQNNQQMTINPAWTTAGGTIDTKGLYTPNKVGKYLVTATQGSVSGSANITVTPGVLAKIDVTPKTATITADQTQQYNATGSDAKGNAVPITPTWSASGGSISTAGLYAPDKIGTYTITAKSGAISGTASITVIPGKIVSLVVKPPTATITADDTQQFNASGLDAKGNPVSVTVTWSAGGGGINSTGVYTPNKIGTFMVNATTGSLSASAQITVIPGRLVTVTITPPTKTLEVGQKQTFTVSAKDAKGNDIPASSLTIVWSVEPAALGTITTNGELTAKSAGTGNVTAQVSDGKASKSASALVTVKAGLIPGLGDSTLLLLIIILVAVMAIIVALIIIRRKKKKSQDPFAQYQQPPDYAQYPAQPQPIYPDQSSYPPQQPPPPGY